MSSQTKPGPSLLKGAAVSGLITLGAGCKFGMKLVITFSLCWWKHSSFFGL